jgi:pilus assembly protein CpaF
MKVFGRRDVGEMVPQPPPVPVPSPPPVLPVLEIPRPAPSSSKVEQITTALRTRVLKQIDPAAITDLSLPQLQVRLEQVINEIANEERYELSSREQADLAAVLADDMLGNGPIEPLLRDDTVTDILVNAPNSVYVERRGKLELTDVQFRDKEHIATIAQKIASKVGRRIDESSPLVDARLPDGSRVNVVFPPLAIDSPCISIRKFSRRKLGLKEMAANGTMTIGIAKLLGIAARCRLNIVIAGGTGSGKTMMLNALSNMIDDGERIVSIEDAAELQLQQHHVVRLETRPPNLEGKGQITQRDLVHNSLRMRPDRIIIGEVRGSEAFDVLQAMNTGHDGSMCTIHANNAREALTRIENMVMMGQAALPPRAIRQQIVGAVDLIIHVERMHDGQRRITQVTDICNLEGDVVTTNDIALFEFEGEDSNGRLIGRYRPSYVRPSFQGRLDYFGLSKAWSAAYDEV